MEGAISQIVSREPGNLSLGWLRLLLRELRKLTLSPGERELLRGIQSAALSVGPSVLDAIDRDDLGRRIDEATDSVELEALHRTPPPAMLHDLLERMATEPDPFESDLLVDKIVGPGPRLTLAQGALFARHSAAAACRMFEALASSTAPPPGVPTSIQGIVRDDRVPLRARELLFAQLRSSVAMLTILAALNTGHTLAPWLAHALCETYATGQKAALRLLAGLPGADVPESVLPRQEWVWPAELDAEQAAWEARVEQLAYHPDGPPGDG